MRAILALLAVLVLSPTAVIAQPTASDKATLAWNLPWDADWVTAVSFVGPNRVAAGNNLGDILVWELPGASGGPRRSRCAGSLGTPTRSTAWSARPIGRLSESDPV
jgi:hypothetical protein